MINVEYIAGALRTEAPVTSPEVMARFTDPSTIDAFCHALNYSIQAGNMLDKHKKHFYYGRALDINWQKRRHLPPGVVDRLSNPRTLRLLHASIGLFTEAAELLSALHGHIFGSEPLDLVNFIEEFGDAFWYMAIGSDALHVSFETFMERNNTKLRARYPEKFKAIDANVRDLVTERRALEGGVLDWDKKSPEGHGYWLGETANGLLAHLRQFDRENGFIYGDIANTHGLVSCTWSYRDGSHIAPEPCAEWNLQLDTIQKRN